MFIGIRMQQISGERLQDHWSSGLDTLFFSVVFAGLNEDLVKLLMERDELHMEQDSMLVDVEDLTR